MVFALLAAAVSHDAAAAGVGSKLYDASLGSVPSAQGWFNPDTSAFPTFAPNATETILVNGGGNPYALQFDSTHTGSNSIQDGNSRADRNLDTAVGFELSWRLRLATETHATANRGGFSLIMVGAQQQHALELAFWTDQVWAYDFAVSPNTFSHGATYFVDTTTAHDYRLRVYNHAYSLLIDNLPALSGTLIDYDSPLPDPFDPYNIANNIFFGDDTSSARAKVELEYIALSPIPLPGAIVMAAPAFFLVLRRRRSSRDSQTAI
jgi:hypothetical protein